MSLLSQPQLLRRGGESIMTPSQYETDHDNRPFNIGPHTLQSEEMFTVQITYKKRMTISVAHAPLGDSGVLCLGQVVTQ